MHGKALRYVCRQFHESHSKLSSDQTGRSALAALQSDENPERGLSGAHRERESRRTALAVAAEKRKYVAQTYPRGGILFRAGRRGAHARGRRNVDRAEIRRCVGRAGSVASGVQ